MCCLSKPASSLWVIGAIYETSPTGDERYFSDIQAHCPSEICHKRVMKDVPRPDAFPEKLENDTKSMILYAVVTSVLWAVQTISRYRKLSMQNDILVEMFWSKIISKTSIK